MISLCFWNVENLFLAQSKTPAPFGTNQIPDWRAQKLAKFISEMDAHINILAEVGGEDGLEVFNRHYLKNKLIPSLLPGNSLRQIHLGALIKPNPSLQFKHFSNREMELSELHGQQELTPLFERDLLELHFFKSLEETQNPYLIVLAVHLKSQREDNKSDPNGQSKRKAEVNQVVDHYKKLKNKYPNASIIIMGDFNGHAQRPDYAKEFSPLYEAGLLDYLEWSSLNYASRQTFYPRSYKNQDALLQLDYIFMAPEVAHLINWEHSGIYLKETYSKELLTGLYPSDHAPLLLTLNI